MKPLHKHPLVQALAVALWGVWTGIRLLQTQQTFTLVSALLAAQSGLVAYRLIFRRNQAGQAPGYQILVAWISACLPLAMVVAQETRLAQTLGSAGIALSLYAMWTLGHSFGIAPADRGLVQEGPYRFLRHPMYLGELIALSGAVLGAPTPWNSLVLHLLLVTILWRIHWEEMTIDHYGAYAGKVRWRLLPGIW